MVNTSRRGNKKEIGPTTFNSAGHANIHWSKGSGGAEKWHDEMVTGKSRRPFTYVRQSVRKKKEGKKRTTIEEYRGVDPKIQDASRDENCGKWGDTDSKKSSSVEEASVYGDNLAP